MKIERISENSIRCTLNRADLDSRELKISELAYGTEKARSLFKDMIEQAFEECGFEADDIPLMIEAIPLSPDCIVLVITKVEDPEELDTRFSKFAPDNDDEADDIPSDELDFLDFAGNTAFLGGEQDKADEPSEDADTQKLERLFSFPDYNLAAKAAGAIVGSFRGESCLYKNNSSSKYYLLIKSELMTADEFAGICGTLTEYGTREKSSYATLSYLEEHGDIIIRKDAVRVLALY